MAGPHAARYEQVLDHLFDTYASSLPVVIDWVRASFPRDDATSERAWAAATRAKALDLLRGLLPAATTANVGMFASGQAYEALLLRLAADPLEEPRELGRRLLAELRKVIPSFVARVDRPDRGGAWSEYLATTRDDTRAIAQRHVIGPVAPADPVTLVDVGDTAGMAAAIESVAAEPPARETLLSTGSELHDRHDPGRAAAEHLRFFARLTAR